MVLDAKKGPVTYQKIFIGRTFAKKIKVRIFALIMCTNITKNKCSNRGVKS